MESADTPEEVRIMYRIDHDVSWWGPGLFMFILFLILIGVGIWAVMRLTSRGPAAAAPPLPPPAGRDPALEEVRLRYARGEIDRDEFVRRSHDLGGTVPEITGPPQVGSPPPDPASPSTG
jgi:putative membrane protein